MRNVLIVLIVLFSGRLSAQQPAIKPFYKMSNPEIAKIIRSTSALPITVTRKMNILSARFLGTPYNFKCVGDGPYALMEPWPLVNFKETNCMSYCEHVLALSISDSWDNFFDNLQQIRYRDGLIGMKTRNHYTMADWLPQNSWLLKDVSRTIGGSLTKMLTRTISHRKFFAAKGITDMRDVKPDRTITIDYIPLNDLLKVADNFHNGDIACLIDAQHDNIFSAHMIMIMIVNGSRVIRESTTSGMSTFDTPFVKWVKDKQAHKSDRYLGLAVMRVRDELNTPGRIIKPWDIPGLKAKFANH